MDAEVLLQLKELRDRAAAIENRAQLQQRRILRLETVADSLVSLLAEHSSGAAGDTAATKSLAEGLAQLRSTPTPADSFASSGSLPSMTRRGSASDGWV